MQDGASIPREEPGEWLREHYARAGQAEIELKWDAEAKPDAGAYGRLLEILFTPHADSPAP